ncbi:MAG: hypothetical protein AAF985_10745 [Bacteroidota bacterium]
MKKIVFLLLFPFLFFQCENDGSTPKEKRIDYAHLAKAYCDCSQKSIELNVKMKGLLENGENDAFQAMVNEVSEAYTASLACCQATKTAHTSKEIDKKKLGNLLKKDCAEMPDRLVLEVLTKIN